MGLLSTQIKDNVVHFALLLIRLSAGVLMMPHGYAKLIHYAERKDKFMNFMGLGSAFSLALVIFAEFFCSALLAAGLLTRLVLVPLIITALVIVFKAHGGEIFGDAETGFLYLISYVAIFITGPGKYSADKLLLKK
jgi:putative oxidoreductase